MRKYFISAAIPLLFAFMHPIHVSVCDIEYNKNRNALEVVQRIFLDDLEKAIRKQENAPDLDITQPDIGKSTHEMIKSYLKTHFRMSVNGDKAEYTFLGYEIEGDAVYSYLEIEKVKTLNSIEVYSAILTSEYKDQVNLVHIKVDGKLRSMKLTERKKSDILKYR